MAFLGSQHHPLCEDTLVLDAGRDFVWGISFSDQCGKPVDISAGELFFEFSTDPVSRWVFDIEGSKAFLRVDSAQVAEVSARTRWELVFVAEGSEKGVRLAFGRVRLK